MENSDTILEKAKLLNLKERALLIDSLIRTIDEPNEKLDAIWADEAERRLKAHREGKTVGIPFDEVFKGIE